MKKSKPFWICTAICLVFALITVIAMQQGMNIAEENLDGPEFESILGVISQAGGAWIMGIALSDGIHLMLIGIFTAIFISSEFVFGTMKNTLSRGADRIKVYFSKFVVCSAAALIMFATFSLTTLIAGTIVWGFDPNGIVTLSGMLGMVLPQALLVIAFVALFEFFSMTMRSNGGAIAVNIVSVTMVSTLLSAISMMFNGKIDLSQYWLTGAVEKLSTITPALCDIVQGIAIAAGWGIGSIILGTLLFKKQDVK